MDNVFNVIPFKGTRKASLMSQTLLLSAMQLCGGRTFWKGRVHG